MGEKERGREERDERERGGGRKVSEGVKWVRKGEREGNDG